MKEDATGRGFIVGLCVWLIATWSTSQEMACLRSSCEAGDLVAFAAIGIGFLAPAWLAADLSSGLLKDVTVIGRVSASVSDWFGTWGFFLIIAFFIAIFTLEALSGFFRREIHSGRYLHPLPSKRVDVPIFVYIEHSCSAITP